MIKSFGLGVEVWRDRCESLARRGCNSLQATLSTYLPNGQGGFDELGDSSRIPNDPNHVDDKHHRSSFLHMLLYLVAESRMTRKINQSDLLDVFPRRTECECGYGWLDGCVSLGVGVVDQLDRVKVQLLTVLHGVLQGVWENSRHQAHLGKKRGFSCIRWTHQQHCSRSSSSYRIFASYSRDYSH